METRIKLVNVIIFFVVIFISCNFSEEEKFNEVKKTFEDNYTTLNEVVLLSENLNGELKFIEQKHILKNIFNNKLELRLEYNNRHYWIETQLLDSIVNNIHESSNGEKIYLDLSDILGTIPLPIDDFNKIVNLLFKTKIKVIRMSKNKVEFIFELDQFLVFTRYGIGNPSDLKELKENWYYFEYDFL